MNSVHPNKTLGLKFTSQKLRIEKQVKKYKVGTNSVRVLS